MARIESVSACVARVPLPTRVRLANRDVTAREYALVRIRDVDGAEGIGFCYAMNSSGVLLEQAITGLLAPVLLGEESLRTEGLWEAMYREALLLGRVGAVMRALSGLDIALWDLNARRAGVPLFRHLGAAAEDQVPAYASGGYYVAGKTNEALAEELATYVADGFRAVKMRIGRHEPATEEERVRIGREAVGSDVDLMLDANNAWTDLPTALTHMRRIEPFDPYWIEEPFSPDDVDNHARLARATHVTVATGEIEAGRWRFKELLDRNAAGILQADATVCGGITEWRRIAATASSYGVTVTPHAWHDIHVHLVGATTNSRWVEYMPDETILNIAPLIASEVVPKDGSLLLPDRPGLGFEFDAAAVGRYAGAQPWKVVS